MTGWMTLLSQFFQFDPLLQMNDGTLLDVVVSVLVHTLTQVNDSALFRTVLFFILVVGTERRVSGLVVSGRRVRLGNVGDRVLLDMVLLL